MKEKNISKGEKRTSRFVSKKSNKKDGVTKSEKRTNGKTNSEPVKRSIRAAAVLEEKKDKAPIIKKSTSRKKKTGGATKYKSGDKRNILLDEIHEGIEMGRQQKTEKNKTAVSNKRDGERSLKVIALGGLGEIGKNITVFEYGDDIVIIDAGLAFPDEDMPGVDLVIPDFTYLIQNAHKIRGLLITHGHEDHIGAVPYLLSAIDIPVYGTRLSLGIIEGKLDENPPPHDPRLYTVEAGDVVNLGVFKAEFIHVNHSIADAAAILLKTPVGNVFHTGDFKLDVSPIDGRMMDIVRIGQIGNEGVTLMLCESTNAERGGFTPSERTVGGSLDRVFMQNEGRRLIIATFSSNIHRVQQIINASAKYSRKVAVLGRSMTNILGAAVELGYM